MNLLTWHGTIVCLTVSGELVHLPLGAEKSNALSFDDPILPSPIGVARPRKIIHPVLGAVTISMAGAGRTIRLARDGLYLSAEPGQPNATFSRASAAAWETFLPVTPAECACLVHILAHCWIVRNTRRLIRPGAAGGFTGFRLNLGSRDIDIAESLPFLGAQTNAAPARLTLPLEHENVEIILADPAGSPFVKLAKWTFGARRALQIAALAARRHVLAAEPEQSEIDRDVAFLRARGGVRGLSDLLVSLQGTASAAAPAISSVPAVQAEVETTLLAWASREIAPWQLNPMHRDEAASAFENLNATQRGMMVYRFNRGEVTMDPKPSTMPPDSGFNHRAELYLIFFRDVAARLPSEFQTDICMSVGDFLHQPPTVPLFCFQKKRAARSILLPDIDFLLQSFHEDASLADPHAYLDKSQTAVFAGGTTGGMNSVQTVRDRATPRLRAAEYFIANERVDFRLPGLAQVPSPEARALLEAEPFCQKPRLPWAAQFTNRFIISIDGNGATCSRVAVALRSNSVLLKYDSDDVLYYFGGLQPWLHYVPVSADAEIEKILDMETANQARFQAIAAAGTQFANAFLKREAVTLYMAMLLQLYEASFG